MIQLMLSSLLKGLRVILFTVVLLCFVSGCTLFSKDPAKIVIGVSLPTQRDPGWVKYKKAFDKLAKRDKMIKLLVQVSDQDATQQAAQVENLLVKKIDVLILAPQDDAAGVSLVEAAHKSGVKVIALDRLVSGAPIELYASFNNEKVGELQGQYLTEHVPKGNYIVLSGAPTDNNSHLIFSGAMKYIRPLEKKKAATIVMNQAIEDWQPVVAQRLVENTLTKNDNDIQAILAPNDNTAGAIIEALKTQKLAGKVVITGQDADLSALQRIVKGTQSMTVFKDHAQLAEGVYSAAIALAKNEKPKTNAIVVNGEYKVPSYYLSPLVIDKKNIDKDIIQAGYFKRSQIYKGK